MKYYYYPPHQPQYFFPVQGIEPKFHFSLYKPYSIHGKFLWFFWSHIPFIRNLFVSSSIENYIPEKFIRSFMDIGTLISFNMGTPGPERKVSALCMLNNSKYFLKFAQTEIACLNVKNEASILKQLKNFEFVPQIINFQTSNSYAMLYTSFLEGVRYGNVVMNNSLLSIIIKMSNLKVLSKNHYGTDLIKSFAHGDFCPWNLIQKGKKIFVYDWELAGDYPLGYDVFVFVFQTSFLLLPKREIHEIITRDKYFIDKYFMSFGINNWDNYLVEFAKLKLELESNKNNENLIRGYNKLLKYAKKT